MLYFKEALTKSGENLMPHILATYLFELAKYFSSFYEKNRIIDAEQNQKLRIDMTKGVANILK
jgi:arginyl-tRNA synthetase